MYKYVCVLLLAIYSLTASAIGLSTDKLTVNSDKTSYAYIRVEGKFLSKKLKVNVDLGDSDEQIEEGGELSKILTDKKSYAAVLNYMSDMGYELVNTLDLTSNYNGSGGTSGIVYIMKKN